ncbi:MAG TPA: tetratricopeptide repeat protein [Candidatus Cloacimonadota bacterium]|nr:tetratricopeptide repeat protein [Candidatus Cloacimonadota bacterium]HPT71507.1 tetratricopeptide repeat protein [Candidatus Cloacimonadota bacterium]
MKKILILLFTFVTFSALNAIDINFIKSWQNWLGTKQYQNKKYPEAGKTFNKNAVNNPNDGRTQFNLGDAYYKNGKEDEAMTAYQKSLSDKNFKDVSKAHQNMGNIHYNKQEFQQALDQYKKSIIESPANKDARFNYEMAKKALMQQKQQQKQDQNKDQKKEEKQQQKSKPQNQQDQKKKDADQVLKALQENERNDMKKQQQQPGQRPKNGKYW